MGSRLAAPFSLSRQSAVPIAVPSPGEHRRLQFIPYRQLISHYMHGPQALLREVRYVEI